MFGRLFVADAKMIVRNRQSLFWALIFPIMFTAIFGLFNFDQLPEARVALVADDPVIAGPVLAGLRQVPAVKVCGQSYVEGKRFDCGDYEPVGSDALRARAGLADGDVDFALVMRGGTVTVVVNREQADVNRIFVPIFERVLDEVNIRLAGIERRYSLVEEKAAGRPHKYYDFVLPGLVGMAVMTYGIIGLASTIAQYRGQRILRRILATPLRPRTFLGAIVAAHLALAIVQSVIVLAFGVFVWGGNVRGNLFWIALFVLAGNLTFLNIGFMVASRIDTAEAASGLGNAVSMPMMFFSGVFFPTETLPWILPALTRILPLYPMVEAIRAITVDATPITELWPQLAQLAAWAAGTYVVASRMFRFERA
jgi:ABC-2 type transport system permease protein